MSLKPEFVKMAKEFFAANSVTQGLSGEHHTALVRNWICESIFTDYSMDSLREAEQAHAQTTKDTEEHKETNKIVQEIKRTRAELYSLLYPLMNGSALRQRFEDAQVLTKTATGKKGMDATALANKYV